jgi:DNA-binding transcriptional LysR family regulator
MINFRLEVFFTTAKELSFTKAAELLSVSQPAVTKHIKALEEHYQTALFQRIGNNIELTWAGKILFQYASEIIEKYELLNADLQKLSQLKRFLNIGTTSEMSSLFLANLVTSGKYFPFELNEINISHSEIENMLRQNEIDLALSEIPVSLLDLHSEVLVKSEFSEICATRHLFAKDQLELVSFVTENSSELITHNKIVFSKLSAVLHSVRFGAFKCIIPEILVRQELENREFTVLSKAQKNYTLYIVQNSDDVIRLNDFKQLAKRLTD